MKTNPFYRLAITIESTNGSTLTTAVEALLAKLKKFQTPETGEVFEGDYYRLTVK